MPDDILASIMSKAKKRKGFAEAPPEKKNSEPEKPFDLLEAKAKAFKTPVYVSENKTSLEKELDKMKQGSEPSVFEERPMKEAHEEISIEKEAKPEEIPAEASIPLKEKTEKLEVQKPVLEERDSFEPETEKELKISSAKKELERYGDVKIYKIAGKPLLYYYIPTPRPTASERAIIRTLKEAATRLITFSPFRIRDIQQRKNVYKQKILEIIDNAPELKIPSAKHGFYADLVVREMVGYGLIDQLLDDDNLEEIMIIGSQKPVYVFHRKYDVMKTNIEFFNEEEINDLINRIAREVGRRVDISSPMLDARLPDGSRVNATIAPASISGSTLTIRKFKESPFSIIDLILFNTVDLDIAAFLWVAAEGLSVKPANILIAGGTGSGKTTLLNVLTSMVPSRERVITIEDSVAGDEEIFIFDKNGNIEKRKISEIVDKQIELFGSTITDSGHEKSSNFEDVETFCFDKEGKIKKAKIGSFIRHKVNKKLFEVLLASGKKIKVTQDHSLFTLDENAEIVMIKPEELTEESFIATPRFLPVNPEGIEKINILNYLEKLNDFFVCGQKISDVLNKIPNKNLVRFSSGKTKDGKRSLINRWRRKGELKISIFKELFFMGYFSELDFDNFRIKTKLSKSISSNVLISKEFLEFIGLWIADGCYDKNSVLITVQEKELKNLVKKIGRSFNLNVNNHSDGFSLMLNSKLLKSIMKDILDLKGNSFTKSVPFWVQNLSNEQLTHFLRGYFSGDGTVSKYSIEWTSCSEQLMKDIQGLLLRIKIHSRFSSERSSRDKTFKGRISSYENISLFESLISFNVKKKNEKLWSKALIGKATHSCSDVVPIPAGFLRNNNEQLSLQHGYYSGKQRIGYQYLKLVALGSSNKTIQKLSEMDFFWDRVKKVVELPQKRQFVYDLSVPNYENFVCSNIFVHNTAELNLPLEHWIRFEAKPPGLEGKGEITLDVLTKNSLRMRPDRIIVGEIRHNEAFTLFTAMNTGHDGCIGTVHSNSAEETIVRLTNPPMDVPLAMLAGLDLILVEQRIHDRKKGTIRRITEIAEVSGVLQGKPKTRPLFVWDPTKDEMMKTGFNSDYLTKVSKLSGVSIQVVFKEIENRKTYLKKLLDKNVRELSVVSDLTEKFLLGQEK